MSSAAARWACVLVLVVLSVVHLTAQYLDRDGLADTTQVLLMPAVALVLLAHTKQPRGRLVRWTAIALFFSWLGDTLPRFTDGDPAFLLMVGGFLVAQCVYVGAFWPFREASVAVRYPWVLGVAGAAVAVLLVVCAPQAGLLTVPVAVYAVALVAMTLLGNGVNALVGWGAVIFLVSDALIGLDAFTDLDVAHISFWIMLTYVLGQSLITAGVVRQAARRTAPGPSATA